MRRVVVATLAVLSVPGIGNAQVYLYEHCNYGGQRIELNDGYNSLTSMVDKGLPNDSASSVWINGPWGVTLYEDYRLLGSSRELRESSSCLHGFNDVVSSAQVFSTAPRFSAQEIRTSNALNFMIGGDPQIGYYPASVRNGRTLPTLKESAALAKACTDCAKILVVAGDLVMDNTDAEPMYGDAHKSIEAAGVKVFDGLGNHDNNNFADDWVSFDSLAGLYHSGVLPPDERSAPIDVNDAARTLASNQNGWGIHMYRSSRIDYGIQTATVPPRTDTNDDRGRSKGTPCGSFRFDDAYYCVNAEAYYYSVALYPMASKDNAAPYARPAAFLVQLHNAMRSETAVAFLTAFADKVVADGHQDVPVVLVAHQMESSDFSGSPTGLAINEFNMQAARLNVAAVLMGHYGCIDRGGKEYGHCDLNNTLADVTDPFATVVNRHGAGIRPINTNAFLHNIFWMVSLSPADNMIAFRRINRGGVADMGRLGGSINTISAQIDRTSGSTGGANFPSTAGHWYVCDFRGGGCAEREKSW